jgi:Putative protein-S-isoprenylcysteine methyltransferase
MMSEVDLVAYPKIYSVRRIAKEIKTMRTPNFPNRGQPQKVSIPRWMAVIIALFFWIILLPLVHGGIPWAISLLAPRYGWREGRPANLNLLGLIPVALATACLTWLMCLHLARTSDLPDRVELERTPKYLLFGGPYAFTRHPMYLAELALWLGWSILYGSIVVFIGFLVEWLIFNFVIVPREESALEARFGKTYLEYKNRVPRWFGKR